MSKFYTEEEVGERVRSAIDLFSQRIHPVDYQTDFQRMLLIAQQNEIIGHKHTRLDSGEPAQDGAGQPD